MARRNWLAEYLQGQQGPAAGLLAQPEASNLVGQQGPMVPSARVPPAGLPAGASPYALMQAYARYFQQSGRQVDPLEEPLLRRSPVRGGGTHVEEIRGAAKGLGTSVTTTGPRAGQMKQTYELPDGRLANVYVNKRGKRSVFVFKP